MKMQLIHSNLIYIYILRARLLATGLLKSMGFPTELYEQSRSSGTSDRKTWKLLGVPMGIRCLARALGIHERRMCPTGRVDRRFKCTGAAPRLECKIKSFGICLGSFGSSLQYISV